MEKKLRKLFDYQKLEGNAHLARLIAETENRYMNELGDDELDLVNAAGDINSVKVEKNNGGQTNL